MLNESDDNEFVWVIAQASYKMKYDQDDPVYWQGETAAEFFMIYQGKVKLLAQNGFPFVTYD